MLSWLLLRNLNVASGVSEIGSLFFHLILSSSPALDSSSFLTPSSKLIVSGLSPVVFEGFYYKHLIIMRMMFLEAGDEKAQT